MSLHFLKNFFKNDSASGLLLMMATAVALLVANSPLSHWYDVLVDLPVAIKVGNYEVAKPLLLWVNDGLMAVFFFLVGLELKRELLEGELSSPGNIVLPTVAAIGGMAVPALIYVAVCWNDPIALEGWAIPAATDIAFAIGIMMLVGSRVPPALKLFLVSLAIIDDLGAIIIIAVFYTDNIDTVPLIICLSCLPILAWMNAKNVTETSLYILVGVVLWNATLKSGVHATLAGVVLAFFIPLKNKKKSEKSPLRDLEENLHPAVYFVILPIFAFANAGISFDGMGMNNLTNPVTLGVILGLFFGKQLGVFGFSVIAIKAGFAKLPKGVNYSQLYGAAILCGVGFTMSLFIGSLAFEGGKQQAFNDERLGILIGSFLSAVVGYFLLKKVCGKSEKHADKQLT